ncbi:MAG: selenium metabolism-associated LysR family transcriptional regulator, partial [Deltaproteobacteria bacterium]
SFSRAAEKSFLTQSTVSQHIFSLENEFALKLFDRTGKGALLTEAGRLLLLHTRRVIAEAGQIPIILNRFKGLEEALLRLGGSNIPGSYMIPDFLPYFQRKHPGVTIILSQGDSRETIERLKREEVELAILGSRFYGEEHVYTPVTVDKIELVVNSGHRWNRTEKISLEDLIDESFIFREPGSGTDRTVRAALIAAGFAVEKLNCKIFLGSNEAVKQAIRSGAGISFLSRMSVKNECEQGELRMVKIEGLNISRHIYLATLQGRELSPAAKAFSALITDHYLAEEEREEA